MDLYSALDDKYLVLKALRHGSQCNLQTTQRLPLAFVRIHQMAPPRTVVTSSFSLLLIHRPRKDERLSWPSWLTYSARFTHISGHTSAVGRAQDSKSSPVKDQRSTAEPRNQPIEATRHLSTRPKNSPPPFQKSPLLWRDRDQFVVILFTMSCVI